MHEQQQTQVITLDFLTTAVTEQVGCVLARTAAVSSPHTFALIVPVQKLVATAIRHVSSGVHQNAIVSSARERSGD